MHYVYRIQSVRRSSRNYVGYSLDLRQRLADHNAGATWLNRCTMPGRWRSTPMQVSVSSRCVTAAGYKDFTDGS